MFPVKYSEAKPMCSQAQNCRGHVTEYPLWTYSIEGYPKWLGVFLLPDGSIAQLVEH